jgi:hypothetical protein
MYASIDEVLNCKKGEVNIARHRKTPQGKIPYPRTANYLVLAALFCFAYGSRVNYYAPDSPRDYLAALV